jgi:hypothetical protein
VVIVIGDPTLDEPATPVSVPMSEIVLTVTASLNVVGLLTATSFLVAVSTTVFSGFRVVVVGVIESCSVAPVLSTTLPSV